MKIYIGSYTTDLMSGAVTGSRGIYVCEFDDATGRIRVLQTEGTSQNPSFVTVSSDNRLLLAANELLKDGALDTYAIGENGYLAHRSRIGLDGSACCFATLPGSKKFAVGVHYMDGELFSYGLEEDGSFRDKISSFCNEGSGPVLDRQEGPHAHSSRLAEEMKMAVVCDLGCDLVTFYSYDREGKLTPDAMPAIKTPKGCGPRHSEFTENAQRLYLSCELSNEVLFYERTDGRYELRQRISTLPESYTEDNTVADIHFGGDGRYLYVSNRGHDSLAWYVVAEDGSLSYKGCRDCGGKTPRNFAVTKRHIICANQDSGNVTVLNIRETGEPGDIVFEVSIPGASCIALEN